MLDWSMVDLSKAARVSVSTIKRAETEGDRTVPAALTTALQDALQEAGITFVVDDGSGVGLRCRRIDRRHHQ